MREGLKVFISYAHEDEKYKDKLYTQLAVVRRLGLIETWDDRQIDAGANWRAAIEEALETCDVALFLVSDDFIASDFINSVELTRLLKRREEEGTLLVPIIVRPCAWQHLEHISNLQVLPKDGRPIITFPVDTGERDEAWTDITERLTQWANHRLKEKHLAETRGEEAPRLEEERRRTEERQREEQRRREEEKRRAEQQALTEQLRREEEKRRKQEQHQQNRQRRKEKRKALLERLRAVWQRPVAKWALVSVFSISVLALVASLLWPRPPEEPVGDTGTRPPKEHEVETGTQPIEYKESYALVVGVSDYTHGWRDLPGVKQDMPAVQSALERHGFKVTLVHNPTSDELNKAILEFIGRYGAQKNNRLLFYFAGHGYTVKRAWGEAMGYFVPVNAPKPNGNRTTFENTALAMRRVEEYAMRIDSNHALFVFDSCFSGSIFSTPRGISETITAKTGEAVRQFITSGSADEEVPDESIFRGQFIEALQEGVADANDDGYITGTELGEYLHEKVVLYSKEAQHPQYGKIRHPNLDKGDFIFRLAPDPFPALLADLQVNVNVDGAAVYIDGDRVGTASPQRPFFQTDMPADKVEIRVEAEGFQSEIQRVELAPNKLTGLHFTLKPLREARISLQVRSNVYHDEVVISGQSYGATPLVLELEPGEYTLRVRKQGYLPYEQRLTLTEDTRVRAELKGIEVATVEWVDQARTELAEPLTDERLSRGLKLLHQALDLVPSHRGAHRVLMELLARYGRQIYRALETKDMERAEKTYKAAERLVEEFELASPELTSLAEKIKDARAREDKIKRLVSQALQALDKGRLTSPEENNAVAYTRKILGIDPQHSDAKAVLSEVVARYTVKAGAALEEKNLASAREIVSQAKALSGEFGIEISHLDRIEDQIAKAERRQQAQREEQDRRRKIGALLGEAEQAIRDDRLTAPSGRNAVDHLRQVLAIAPHDPRARQMLTQILGDHIRLGSEALQRQDLPSAKRQHREGARLVAEFGLPATELAKLKAAIDETEQRLMTEKERRIAEEKRVARMDELAELAKAALRADHLMQPKGDNTVGYLRELQSLAPADERVRALLSQLLARYTERIESTLAGGDLPGSRRHHGEAERIATEFDLPMADLARLKTSIVEAEQAKEKAERSNALLTNADQAIEQNRLITPSGDNAVHYLRQALALVPNDPRIRQKLQQVISRVIRQAEQALEQHKLQDADDHYQAGKRLASEFGLPTPELAKLESKITEERARQAEIAARIAESANLVETALQEDRLTQPPGNSAVDYLRELQSLAPKHPSVNALLTKVLAGYIERIETALAQNDPERSRRHYDEAARVAVEFGFPMADLVQLKERIAEAEHAPQADVAVAGLLQKAEEAMGRLHLTTPPGDNAVEYMREALALAPNDPRIRQMLSQVVDRYVHLGERALQQDNVRKATRRHQSGRRVAAEFGLPTEGLTELESHIEETNQRLGAVSEQQRAEQERRAREEAERLAAEQRQIEQAKPPEVIESPPERKKPSRPPKVFGTF